MGEPRKQISYSYLHSLACGYASFLHYEGRMRGPTTPPLALGNALHFALEKGYLQPKLSLDKFVELFLAEHRRIIDADDVFISYAEIKKNESEGTEMLQRYWKGVEKGYITQTPHALEQEFTLPIGDTTIIGKIDRVDMTPQGIVVTDYKTGRKEPDTWFLNRNLQFTTYWWAAKEIYGEYPVKAVWHHLRTGKLIETTRTEWDIEQLKRLTAASITLQQQDIRPRIYHEQVCNWCPFKGETCDDTELEDQILARRKPVGDTEQSVG